MHYFAVLARTLGGRGAGGPGAGRDLAATPQAGAAVERAERTGLPAASEPYVALRDVASTDDPQPQTVALVQRVIERRTGALRGYLQLTVRVQDFFGDTMLQPARDLLDVSLAAYAGTELRTIAAIHRGDGRADLHHTAEVQVADRKWRTRVAADSGTLVGAGTSTTACSSAGSRSRS